MPMYMCINRLDGLRTLSGAAHSCHDKDEFFVLAKKPKGVYAHKFMHISNAKK